MLRNIAIKISYVGIRYYGWQIQKDVPTVQGEIIKAVERITGERVKVWGASRTDGGVHALGQVGNFFTSSDIPPERFKYALNSVLPHDIRVIKSVEVPQNFNARRSPSIKTYRYIILQGEINPFLSNFVLSIKTELDIEKMSRCAKMIEGEHDFKNFTPEKENTKRTIISSEIVKKGRFVIYEIKGYSFLRYMVRNIVGKLIMVGMGKMSEEEFEEILKGDRIQGEKNIPFTAPPHGLYLVSVKYLNFKEI